MPACVAQKNPALAGFFFGSENAQAAEAAFFDDLAFLVDFFSALADEADLAAGAAFSALAAGAAAAGAEAAWANAPNEKVAAIRAAMILFMMSPLQRVK